RAGGLVVEDDAMQRERIRSWLGSQTWLLIEAENARVALDRLRECIADVIILDLMMPEMDGFQLVAEMQKHPVWNRIPIIVVTARDLTVARSDDNDRDSVPDRMLLHHCYELKSVHLWHHQIENDDVRNAFPEPVEGYTRSLGLDQKP